MTAKEWGEKLGDYDGVLDSDWLKECIADLAVAEASLRDTELAAVERERAAYCEGRIAGSLGAALTQEQIKALAAHRYPMPEVK